MDGADELWTTCADRIREDVSDAVWFSTFAQVTAVDLDEIELVLAVPHRRAKDHIEGRYLGLVRGALSDAGAGEIDIRVVVQTEPEPDEIFVPIDPLDPSADLLRRVTHVEPDSELIPDDRYTFEAFVTGDSNRFAEAAAQAVAETPGRSYNPLFIYGDPGLGKTHLLQAIGHYVSKHYPTYTVRYTNTERLFNEFVDAIRNNTQLAFKERYREVDLLLVDDVQFIEGRERLQEEFFHTFDALYQAKRQIVLSSDRPPDSIKTLEARLRGRFKMGLITDIQPPDLETRLAILRKKGEEDPVFIPDTVLTFIASNITDNIRELEGALTRVTAYARLTRQDLTPELAERVLAEFLTLKEPRQITVDLIIERTAVLFDLDIVELTGGSRRRPLVQARQIAMYVSRNLTQESYPSIGRAFGNRDHTTVIHAVEKISRLMPERQAVYDQVTRLMSDLRSGD